MSISDFYYDEINSEENLQELDNQEPTPDTGVVCGDGKVMLLLMAKLEQRASTFKCIR